MPEETQPSMAGTVDSQASPSTLRKEDGVTHLPTKAPEERAGGKEVCWQERLQTRADRAPLLASCGALGTFSNLPDPPFPGL